MKKIRRNTIPAMTSLKSAVFALPIILIMLIAEPVVALNGPYTTSANYVMFDIDRKIIYCEGQTELLYGMLRVQAEKMRVDVKTHVLHAEGKVTIETMLPRNLRESAEESLEAGQEGEDDVSSQEQTVRQMEEMEESVRKSNIQTYEGNVLVYDLTRRAGVLVKTSDEVRKIYLQGETLDMVAELPQMTEPGYLYEEPSIMANAWTAKRIRVSADGKYEAWSTMLWFKGNKVFSLPLPYYTNTGQGLTPGNLRLKRVSYSSNSDWNIGALYEYSEKKGREGTVNLRYSADSSQWYRADLRQRFRLGKRIGGSLGLQNILSGSRSYNMSFSRSRRGSIQSFNSNFGEGGRRSYSLNDTRRVRGLSVNSFITTNKDKGMFSNSSNIKALVRLSGNTKYIDKQKKYKYRVNSSLEWENARSVDTDGSMFVGVSVFRSAIRLSRKSHMNTSLNLGLGRDTGGYSRDSYSTGVTYSLDVGRSKRLGLSYKVGQSRTDTRTNATQYVSISYSFSKISLMNMRLSSSYDLRRSKLGTVSSRFSYDFNKRCSLWSDLVYDVNRSRFNIKNYSMKYDLYGSIVNTRWYTESNDFIMDIATKF